MSLPVMGLCPDSRRTLNFCSFMKKSPNTTMLDKGGVTVYSSSNGCTADPMIHSEQKFHSYFSQTPHFHERKFIPSLTSVLIGGFLGSKSQVRPSNPLIFWDIVRTTVGAATECLKQHCDFSSAPSPPKKKFAKEEGLANLAIVDFQDFPCVVDKQKSEVSLAEGPKQSYAEVARAPSSKPSRANISNHTSDPRDLTAVRPRRRGNRRRSHSSDHKNSRKRASRQQASNSDSLLSPISESQSEDLKDLRLDQQKEKQHFSHLKTDHNNRNCIKSNRRPSSEQREQCQKEKQQSHHRPKRHMQSRSHCEKRGAGARNFNCDIDKINWRTGEPIVDKMGSQHNVDMDTDELASEKQYNESCTSTQSNADCNGELRKLSVSPAKVFIAPSYGGILGGIPICRLRRSSECSVDSEDSFIVFQTGATSDDTLSDLTSDYSDSDTYESDSSEEDDLCDGLSPTSLRLREVNDLWRRDYQVGAGSNNALQWEDDDVEVKKVRFSDSKPTIHRMLTWDFAYRSARLGPWEQMVRDRDRFKTRIQLCESTISPVLNCDHRNKIWKKLHSQEM
ncbi:hypothetical protein FOCC_FOCC005762 [Frankliniella occidentalis]|uniref:Protein DP71L n=1 Tax=Frankliniella occidentalis TaxID=133901 RepID=A0A6J1SFA2_FRAOC|nr:uncharacterized protein LOC113207174 [Frankliniella occidentalis]KAE8747601.1 hypothetical protein FOCC_FOCC005762 [Frankliniella occidentalis]